MLVADSSQVRRIQWASMGDSAVIVTPGASGALLTEPRHHFVGYPMTRQHLAARLQRGAMELTPDAWVVAVTDGFTNFVGPRNAGRTVAELVRDAPDAVAAVHRLVDRAGAMGAGDNVAVAVVRPRFLKGAS